MTTTKKFQIKNSSGLLFDFLENGSVRSFEADSIRIGIKGESPFSKSGPNLYLRILNQPISYIPLLGPESKSKFSITETGYTASGIWEGIQYECSLILSANSTSWAWFVEVSNLSCLPVEMDLVYVQDIGLKSASNDSVNEYYISQYLERLILEDPKYGPVVCCRQNLKEKVGNPWLMLVCKNAAHSASMDGMQFYGKKFRETGQPEGLFSETLGGEYAGESSIVALQEKPFHLDADGKHLSVFAATFQANHAEATSTDDLKLIQSLFSEFEAAISPVSMIDPNNPVVNIFNTSDFLPVDDLSNKELESFFGPGRRHAEIENDTLLSFFTGQNDHVVLRAKEIEADRPHGHIMQAKAAYRADENIVSTTSFAFGVFNSHLTQGNTNFNIFLSVCTTQFNQSPESGQRIFVEIDGKKYLLGVPSAFEMGLNHCRWIYVFGKYCFQVRTWTSKSAPQVNLDFKVLRGKKVRLIITHQFDGKDAWHEEKSDKLSEFIFKPKSDRLIAQKFPSAQFKIIVQGKTLIRTTGDEGLFADQLPHGNPFFVIHTEETNVFCMSFLGEVCEETDFHVIENPDSQFVDDCREAQMEWNDCSLGLSFSGGNDDTKAIQEILPWFGMNAITHFLTPHGLEQFGGAAWGTRDVSQGPFDFLMCLGKYEDAKQVLRIIFSNQNTLGDWPQWWMFDSYFNIRAGDCHGDVYYWCLIAISNYVKVTGDVSFLGEVLPFYHEKGVAYAEKTTLGEHLDRLIKMIVDSFIPGTAFVPFGGGDWNDSLQPVSEELANRMISSWTVEMNYQAFMQLQPLYEKSGNQQKVNELRDICERIKSDFNTHLIKDGVVAGYGLVQHDGTIGVLLHPQDQTTHISYSILPMDRGIISELFTKEQAEHHQQLIDQHLKGPDGARLMDRPLTYKGGIQSIFQRAESSVFFGREIGLMYIHEHIRYAESQAMLGNADAFIKALRQANPVDYRKIVPCGDIRQANCYYSSSDVVFKNRYDADVRYADINSGEITLRGGWRVYSSGPGIYIAIVITRFLGLRTEFGKVIFDPVIPKNLDGFSASLQWLGYPITIHYAVKQDCYGPKEIRINGQAIKFGNEDNKYRKGGAIIAADEFVNMLKRENNNVEILL